MEGGKLLVRFGVNLHTAAKHLDDVGDDVVFKDFIKIRLQAVQNLSAHRNDCLELCVASQLAGTQRRVTLHDVDFPLVYILRAAVHKLFHPVGKVDGACQFLFQVQSGLFCILAAALVDQHLFGNLDCLVGIFDEVDLHLPFEEIIHRLIDKFIGDCFFCLVFIGGLGGEGRRNQYQTVLHILKGNLAFILEVLAVLLEIAVYL